MLRISFVVCFFIFVSRLFGREYEIGGKLLSILYGSNIHRLFEYLYKMRGGGKAALIGNFRDGAVGRGEQIFGIFQPFIDNVLFRRNVHYLFKNMTESIVGIFGNGGKLFS